MTLKFYLAIIKSRIKQTIIIFALMTCSFFLMSPSCSRIANPVLTIQNPGNKTFQCQIYQYNTGKKELKFSKNFEGQVFICTIPYQKDPDKLSVFDKANLTHYRIRLSLSKGSLYEFVVTSQQDTIVHTIDISEPHKCDTIIIHSTD